jgi:DNA-binding Xre family transcriptional regulator
MLTEMGLQTPRWSTAAYMREDYPPSTQVVVYDDVYSHRGEDKRLLPLEQVLHNPLCSVFIPPKTRATSIRYLRIGNSVFWLHFASDDKWRSNIGSEVKVTMHKVPEIYAQFRDSVELPMVAIDFVESIEELLAAVDLNTAPGLSGTPIQDILSGEQVVDAIKEWYTPPAEPEPEKERDPLYADAKAPTLAGNVTFMRKALAMSMTELAQKAGISLSMVSRIESGEKNPSIRTLVKLAAALEVNPNELLGE